MPCRRGCQSHSACAPPNTHTPPPFTTRRHSRRGAGCSRVGQEVSPVAACTALQALCLDTCGLAAFPSAAVAGLASLSRLCLDNNAIPELPLPPLEALPELEELTVRNNSLTALPPQLALLPRLRTLSVDGNMLRTIRRSVLDRGSPALLEYLHSRLPL